MYIYFYIFFFNLILFLGYICGEDVLLISFLISFYIFIYQILINSFVIQLDLRIVNIFNMLIFVLLNYIKSGSFFFNFLFILFNNMLINFYWYFAMYFDLILFKLYLFNLFKLKFNNIFVIYKFFISNKNIIVNTKFIIPLFMLFKFCM